jgi:cytoplasmic iron level regulating protein YaaA (DUF328/UPF0246 family)
MIVSPAKRMEEGSDMAPITTPALLSRSEVLVEAMRRLSYEELRDLWRCSDAIARPSHDRLFAMDLTGETHPLTPAVMAYRGIQYQHMAPQVLDERGLAYLGRHLRIVSGLYGILRPFDGVAPYRLEMQARLAVPADDGRMTRDLYAFWGDSLARALADEADVVVNLASVEYAKAVFPRLEALRATGEEVPRTLTCLFGTLEKGRLVQRATEAKAARGTFVRWCAEEGIEDVDRLRSFSERGYHLDEGLSLSMDPDGGVLAFVRRPGL